MQSSSDEQRRRILVARRLDIGLPAGLALAMVAVLAIDRSLPEEAPRVDLVFILDQGPAMAGAVDAMKANCLEKAEGLQSGGLDCRLAVVPFGRGGQPVSAIPLTDDLAAFKQRLMEAPAAGETQAVASGAEALEQASRMDFRQGASVFFFLITNTPGQGGDALAGIAGQMNQRGIKAIIQADAAEQDSYKPLYQNGGRFFSLEGEDLTGPIAASSDGDKTESQALSLLAPSRSGIEDGDPSVVLEAKGLYGLRTEQQRDKWITKVGGSPESELAVKEGLAWLARHQADDGHWSDESKCETRGQCRPIMRRAAVAETGLAILAFQAGGHYSFNGKKYSDHVTRGLDWLVSQQKKDGCLFGPVQTWYEHGMATFALAEACAVALAEGREPDKRYLDAAERAIKFIEDHQYARGGWQYALDSGGRGDSSVTGWQVLALKSALEAKIDVAPATMERVQQFFEYVGDPRTGRTGYQSRGGGTDLTTAVGLIVQQFILKTPDSELARKAVEYLKGRATAGIGQSGDFYTLYNATLAMFLAGGDSWEHWNDQIRDAVLERQEKRGCARGSWNSKYARTLDTAWAVLTLEVYYRYATGQKGDG